MCVFSASTHFHRYTWGRGKYRLLFCEVSQLRTNYWVLSQASVSWISRWGYSPFSCPVSFAVTTMSISAALLDAADLSSNPSVMVGQHHNPWMREKVTLSTAVETEIKGWPVFLLSVEVPHTFQPVVLSTSLWGNIVDHINSASFSRVCWAQQVLSSLFNGLLGLMKLSCWGPYFISVCTALRRCKYVCHGVFSVH